MCMNRDSNFEEANVNIMAKELDRLIEKHKREMDWDDRLDAANILRKEYGAKLRAMDRLFSVILPKYPKMMSDPEVQSLAVRFIEFGDRFNAGERAGHDFDVHSFQGASLNEMRLKIREIIRVAIN